MSNIRNAGRKSKISEDALLQMKERVDAGESIASLAREAGISRQALHQRLNSLQEASLLEYDFEVDGEITTKICIDFKHESLQIENYTYVVSKLAFGLNENPSWQDLLNFLEEEYFREHGVVLSERRKNYLYFDLPHRTFPVSSKISLKDSNRSLPQFTFRRQDLLLSRTDTAGYQLKALTQERRTFVKSQAIISGLAMRDYAVEVVATDLCHQLNIPCVEQRICSFVVDGRKHFGVYSTNFELDGFSFCSFASLANRMGKSLQDQEYIALSAIEKLKYCANILAEAGHLSFASCEKYMLDLALLDCLIGNVDRHSRNFGLFYSAITGEFQIPLAFDHGMGLFEHDPYRDEYQSFEEAMRTVYVAPYGEDPFEMIHLLDAEYHLLERYPGLSTLTYSREITRPFALEYEKRMMELWHK